MAKRGQEGQEDHWPSSRKPHWCWKGAKQWSWLSRGGSERRRAPGGAVAQQGVEDEQQLVHAGGERHLLGLAGGTEPLIEGAQDGVVPNGDERAHVQGGAHARAA